MRDLKVNQSWLEAIGHSSRGTGDMTINENRNMLHSGGNDRLRRLRMGLVRLQRHHVFYLPNEFGCALPPKNWTVLS